MTEARFRPTLNYNVQGIFSTCKTVTVQTGKRWKYFDKQK